MRMVVTEHVTYGARRLGVLGVGAEADLAHGVDDPPLDRLQAVGDVWQRPVVDDVHRVVEVRTLGEGGEG